MFVLFKQNEKKIFILNREYSPSLLIVFSLFLDLSFGTGISV